MSNEKPYSSGAKLVVKERKPDIVFTSTSDWLAQSGIGEAAFGLGVSPVAAIVYHIEDACTPGKGRQPVVMKILQPSTEMDQALEWLERVSVQIPVGPGRVMVTYPYCITGTGRDPDTGHTLLVGFVADTGVWGKLLNFEVFGDYPECELSLAEVMR